MRLTPTLKCVDRLCSQSVGVLASSLTKCRKARWGLEPKLKWMPDLCWRREIQMNRAGQRQTQRGDGCTLFRSDGCNFFFIYLFDLFIFLRWISHDQEASLTSSVYHPSCFFIISTSPPPPSLSRFCVLLLSCHCSLSEVIEGKRCAAAEY